MKGQPHNSWCMFAVVWYSSGGIRRCHLVHHLLVLNAVVVVLWLELVGLVGLVRLVLRWVFGRWVVLVVQEGCWLGGRVLGWSFVVRC